MSGFMMFPSQSQNKMKKFLSGLRIASFIVIAFASICNLSAETNKVADNRMSTSVSTNANMLVKGKISETVVRFDNFNEYTFTALLDGRGKYSMQLFQNETNILEAYSDTKDSFFFNPQGSARFQDGKGGIPMYWVQMYPTPYPFKASQFLQVAWLVLNGNKKALNQVVEEYPPGLVFSDLEFEAMNWYECTITNAVYDQSEYERLLSFTFRSPGHTLRTGDSLRKLGWEEEWINNLRKTPLGDAYIVPLAGKKENGYDVYSYTTTGVLEGFPFQPVAKLERYLWIDTENEKYEISSWYSVSIENAKKTQQSIEPPKFPVSPYLNISDYRFEGIQGKCFDYQYKGNEWPLSGTEEYLNLKAEHVRKLLAEEMNARFNESKFPWGTLLIISIVLVLPFLFLLKNKNVNLT